VRASGDPVIVGPNRSVWCIPAWPLHARLPRMANAEAALAWSGALRGLRSLWTALSFLGTTAGLPRLWFGRFTIQGSGCKRTTFSGCHSPLWQPSFFGTNWLAASPTQGERRVNEATHRWIALFFGASGGKRGLTLTSQRFWSGRVARAARAPFHLSKGSMAVMRAYWLLPP